MKLIAKLIALVFVISPGLVFAWQTYDENTASCQLHLGCAVREFFFMSLLFVSAFMLVPAGNFVLNFFSRRLNVWRALWVFYLPLILLTVFTLIAYIGVRPLILMDFEYIGSYDLAGQFFEVLINLTYYLCLLEIPYGLFQLFLAGRLFQNRLG